VEKRFHSISNQNAAAAGGVHPEPIPPPAQPSLPQGWRRQDGPYGAPVLDIETTPDEDEERSRSILAILAEAGVVILPEGSGEPGRLTGP